MRKYIWIFVAITAALAGCQPLNETIIPVNLTPESTAQTAVPADKQPRDESMERRFSDTPITKMDAMQSITIWSQRYDELLQKTDKLRQDNTQMTLDNARLQQDVERLRTELQQCRRDVEQSNALLQEAHLELTKWKADVLGFRDEIRQAQAAQLSAMTKILRILGAETAPPSDSDSVAPMETKP